MVTPTVQFQPTEPFPIMCRSTFSIQEEQGSIRQYHLFGARISHRCIKNRVSLQATVTVHRLITGDIRIFYKGQELAYTTSWTNSLGNQPDIIGE